MVVDLAAAKAHLNITAATDDDLIGRLITVAVAHLVAQLGFALDDDEQFPDGTPADLEHAQLMLIAHFYENREAVLVGVVGQALPFGVREIVANYRGYTFAVADDE